MTVRHGAPKYIQIRDQIREWIAAGEICLGEQIPVEHVLAKQFNVSRQTVRQAVTELVHDRVLERRQGRGTFYVGASKQPSRSTREQIYSVAVITNYINSYIFPEIIHGIEHRLSYGGHVMQLMSVRNSWEQERKALQTALAYPVDAVIAEAIKAAYPNPNLDLFAKLREKHIPVLMINSTYDGLDAPVISVDDRIGGSIATTYIASQGHTQIGGMFKLDEKQGILRLEGFLEALHLAGIPFRHEWMSFFTSESWPMVCRQYAERMVALPPVHWPTAIFCFNDAVAVRLIREFQARGARVPEDISVVGYDDSEMARLSQPMLTTVVHPQDKMGERAAEMILSMLAEENRGDRSDPSSFTFLPQLVVRDSVQGLKGTKGGPSTLCPLLPYNASITE